MAFIGATIDRYGQHLTVRNGPNSIIETADEHLKPGQKLLELEQQARSPEGRLSLSDCNQTVLLVASGAEEGPGSTKLYVLCYQEI